MNQTAQKNFKSQVELILLFVAAAVIVLFGDNFWRFLQSISPQIQTAFTLLLWGGLVVLATWFACKIGIYMHHRKWALRDARFIRIIPCSDVESNPDEVLNFVKSFGEMGREWEKKWLRGLPWFRLRFIRPYEEEQAEQNQEIHLYLSYPQDKTDDVESLIESVYPSANIQQIPHSEFPMPQQEGVGGYFFLRKGRKKGLPLASFTEKPGEEQKKQMGNILAAMQPGTIFDIHFSLSDWAELKERSEDVIDDLQDKKDRDLHPYEKWQKRYFGKRLTGREYTFSVTIPLWSYHPNRNKAKASVKSLANRITTALNQDGGIKFRRHRKWDLSQKIHPSFDRNPIPWPIPFNRMVWTDVELANLFHLPPNKHIIYEPPKDDSKTRGYMPRLILGQNDVPDHLFREGVMIGYLKSLVEKARGIFLSSEKLQNMVLIVGKIGSGKTAAILTFIRDLLDKWFSQQKAETRVGVSYMDPKATGVKRALTYLNKMLQEDDIDEQKIHYFHLASTQYVVGLNLLEKQPGQSDHQVIENALEVLKNAFPNESGLFKNYARLAMRALMADDQTHTIFAIPELLRKESPLRERLIRKLENGNTYQKSIARDLKAEEESYGSAKVDPVFNRINPLKDNPITYRIFGQKKTTLDVSKYLREGHIVLYNTAGLNEEETRLVLGYIVTLYHQGCIRKGHDENHYLAIDEAHQLQLDVLHREIIPLDRERGLVLILLTQFLNQFKSELKQTITEISGNIIAFTSGKETAKTFEEMTSSRFSKDDVMELDSLVGAVYTSDEEGQRRSFLVETEPPVIYDEQGKLTYYGPDRKRRGAETNAAFAAAERLGLKWMARDCLTVKEAQKQIDEYQESLWEEESSDDKKDSTDDQKPSATVNRYTERMKKYKKR